MHIESIKKISDIATLNKGYAIATKDMDVTNNEMNSLKILSIRNVKELIEESNVTYSVINFEKTYNKEMLYVQKNDIVIPVAIGSSVGKFNIFYIEKEPNEKLCYSNSMIVMRVKDENIINSKYLYIQLLTQNVQKKMIDMAEGNCILHISKKNLLDLEIPMLSKEQMKKMCEDYDRVIENEKKAKEGIKKFWEDANLIK